MRSVGEIIESYGHSVRIYGRPMSVGSGGFSQAAEMIMQVSPHGAGPEADQATEQRITEYRISFAFDSMGHKILASLTDANGTSPRPQHDMHPLEGATDVLIEAELLEMVLLIFDQQEERIARHTRLPRRAGPEPVVHLRSTG